VDDCVVDNDPHDEIVLAGDCVTVADADDDAL